jgi:hypothetical protein
MEREEFINALSSFNPDDLKTIVKQANELIAEEKSRHAEEKSRQKIDRLEIERQKREEEFKNADPFTLAVHHVERDMKVKLYYEQRERNGMSYRSSQYKGRNDTFNFRFKLEEGSDAELIVELATKTHSDDQYDEGYPGCCTQILKIRGEEVYNDFERSDDRWVDGNDFSESYDLLKQAGIPQSEIDKVDAVLPKELDEYER